MTDEFVVSRILGLSESTKELRRAKKFAEDYQNRRLLKCVFEKIMTHPQKLQDQIRDKIARKSKVDRSEIFVDTSTTSSLPLTPSKEKTRSIILISRDSRSAKEIPFSKIPVVSSMSESMNILRIYTAQQHRKKVEIAAKSILGVQK
jgi:hypothetical protein